MPLHISHVRQSHMFFAVTGSFLIPSRAFTTMSLGAKSGLNVAAGQTLVHLPHSTQSKAPVSSMSLLVSSAIRDTSLCQRVRPKLPYPLRELCHRVCELLPFRGRYPLELHPLVADPQDVEELGGHLHPL